MDRQGLPGIDALFREQDRLAKKLSQEELNALRRYLHKAVHAECESVVARMRYLQAAHDANESQFQHALVTLQKDLQREQSIASEFRREFGSLARVFQAREQRYQDRHDTLVKEVLRCREAVKEAVKARDDLKSELKQKDRELEQHKDLVVDLEDQLAQHKDCHQLRQDAASLGKDLLAAKLNNDKLRRQLAEATGEKMLADGAGNKTGPPKTALKDKNVSFLPSAKNHVRFSPSVLAPKNTPVTFTPVSPYCTFNTCRARQDLEECRLQFIKKCEEVAYLRCMLSEKKKSRDQHRFPTNRTAASKPSAAVPPLKLTYQRGKELLQSNRQTAVHVKSFKLGTWPVAPAPDKKL